MAKNENFFPGVPVNVSWLDGQTYPAVIELIKGEKYLVKFPNGEERWVVGEKLALRPIVGKQ
jgi:hypothetical protein